MWCRVITGLLHFLLNGILVAVTYKEEEHNGGEDEDDRKRDDKHYLCACGQSAWLRYGFGVVVGVLEVGTVEVGIFVLVARVVVILLPGVALVFACVVLMAALKLLARLELAMALTSPTEVHGSVTVTG